MLSVSVDYAKIHDIRSLKPGEHIAIWDVSNKLVSHQHHGIVWESGESTTDIKIWHVWSPIANHREAQPDTYCRISTLEQFLYNRHPSYLRRVEYHASGLRDLTSRWGETHFAKCDHPEVVLARGRFLLGLGRGEFHFFWQNCEHAAHWCMTGEQWCKQNLTRVKDRVPFERTIPPASIDALVDEIDEIKLRCYQNVVDRVLSLSGRRVFLRVNGDQFVRILDHGQLGIVPGGSEPTPFRLHAYAETYNSIKVRFVHEESSRGLFSRSTLSRHRDIRVKKTTWVSGKAGFEWVYTPLGNLKSMRQHRRYIGLSEGGALGAVSARDQACHWEFVPCEPLSLFDGDDADNQHSEDEAIFKVIPRTPRPLDGRYSAADDATGSATASSRNSDSSRSSSSNSAGTSSPQQ